MRLRRRSYGGESRIAGVLAAVVFGAVLALVVSSMCGGFGGTWCGDLARAVPGLGFLASADSGSADGAGPGLEKPIRVEVLNGAGEPGIAARVSRRLRQAGFDVVYYGNAESFDHEKTVVIQRSDATPGGAAVADSLGLGPERMRRELRPELFLDATVILGADWRSRLRLPAEDGVLPDLDGRRAESGR